jgi:D-hydroxyproline dehydrogenase subunit alpha
VSTREFELLVVGAGPGGMQAALEAGRAGLRVGLVDAAPRPGGQYHRQPPISLGARRPGALHHGFAAAAATMDELDRLEQVELLAATHVWAADRVAEVNRLHVAGAHDGTLEAPLVVLATGATERVIPFPGWDLPGVMTLGAAQALLKWQGIRPGHRVVVAGAGPLILPVASAPARTATPLVAVCDASHPTAWLATAPRLAGAAGKFVEASGYLRPLAARRIPYRPRTAAIRAVGEGRVEEVTLARLDRDWRIVPGSSWTVAADALCTSHGFVPAVELADALGCDLADGPPPIVAVDARQRTSSPGVFAVGESTGVAGAAAATAEGGIAGLVAASDLRRPVARERLRAYGRRRAREHRFAAALRQATEVPDGWTSWLEDDTVICRCEDVAYAQVRRAIDDLGARDLRSVKLTTRCGMGYCQGRICGSTVAGLVQAATGSAPPDATALSTRPITTPVPLGRL